MDSSDKAMLDKFNNIQIEILNIGWKGILEKYHPDNNCDVLNSHQIFDLYKEIFKNMKERMMLE